MHAPCFVVRRQGNISYTPRPSICLELVGSFSYTPRDGICLVVRRVGNLYYMPQNGIRLVLGPWGVSLTRPVLKSV